MTLIISLGKLPPFAWRDTTITPPGQDSMEDISFSADDGDCRAIFIFLIRLPFASLCAYAVGARRGFLRLAYAFAFRLLSLLDSPSLIIAAARARMGEAAAHTPPKLPSRIYITACVSRRRQARLQLHASLLSAALLTHGHAAARATMLLAITLESASILFATLGRARRCSRPLHFPARVSAMISL